MHDPHTAPDDLLTALQAARDHIQQRGALAPRIGMILGSGLDTLADELTDATAIPYRDIPGFVAPSTPGHRGELVLGTLGTQPVAVLRGRLHFYEGYSMQQITFPVRVLHALGCTTLIVTNAAGGLHADWRPGDLMSITDQIFLPGMAGHHPLRGPNDERLGARFPAMLNAFDAELRALAATTAAAQGLTLRQGVYAMVSGPSFESSAELRALRIWGADAVGMSTAPEVVVARHAGMRVLGISLITNLALPDGEPATHSEVLDVGAMARPAFAALLRGIVQQHT
jgi:purine-nucleoside phosphorylase